MIFIDCYFGFQPQYNNLPANLAQQLANLPPLPPQGRGRGRGIQPPVMPVSL